ncbi:MAG: acyl-CoA dehydrogenase family protein [Alphaproteobacteria bacterium]|nr:acyl-CoA dehydrogenase family protein [Alphaproteobacteria bacterium]
MDFNDTPAEAKFRTEVRAWLDANAKPKSATGFSAENPRFQRNEAEALKIAKAWQAKKAAKGYARVTWPKENGGLGGTPMQQVVYSQEESKFDVPSGFFEIGLGMCIPTVTHYASKEVAARYVKPALNGEEIWCQLFSEPSAGSDVAGLRTRAERDGDDWIVNGQKVWTSGAHYSDYGIVLTRTDPAAQKHKGLTMFYLSMKSPGVEVKPIKQMSGGANFNEVYFTNVRIPDSQRLGEVGAGWGVALTTLMHERLAVGGGQGGAGPDIKELIALARETELEDGPAIRNAAVREKIAEWYVRGQGLKYTTYRTLTALSQGKVPGPEASIAKIVVAPKMQILSSFAMDLEDMGGVMTGEDAAQNGAFQQSYMWAPGLRIAGGTDEILKNIIAERVLGLPADIRVDKDIPFNKLPTGR